MPMYEILGYPVPEREIGEPVIGSLPEQVIYETDDPNEVRSLMVAMGYTDPQGVFHAVTNFREKTGGDEDEITKNVAHKVVGDGTSQSMPPAGPEREVRKSEFTRELGELPPQNSMATVDADGRVRSDDTMKPLTGPWGDETMVKKIATQEPDPSAEPRRITQSTDPMFPQGGEYR